MEYLFIILSAIFVNNIVLAQFLGVSPVLEASTETKTAAGMGACVLVIMTLSTIAACLFNQHVLLPLHLGYLQTISFILIIIILVQAIAIILKRVSLARYHTLHIYLPLVALNSAVLGVALMVIRKNFNLIESVVFAAATAVGFALAIMIFSGIRAQLALTNVPKDMAGIPIALITSGILALALMGFAGMM